MNRLSTSSVCHQVASTRKLSSRQFGCRAPFTRATRASRVSKGRQATLKVAAISRPSWLPDWVQLPFLDAPSEGLDAPSEVLDAPSEILEAPSEGAGSSDEYSKEMASKMGSNLTYVHENGTNWARVTDHIIVGSCIQTVEDLDRIRTEENVGTILCLQEDKDMAWWDLDIKPIQRRAAETGMNHLRMPLRDFDAMDIRSNIASLISALSPEMTSLKAEGKSLYVHCTAGLGRAPVVALAYMHWIEGTPLEDAYSSLFAVRRCHPQLKAIREATCDLLGDSNSKSTVTLSIPSNGAAEGFVAGLNVGWGARLPMTRDPATGNFKLERELTVGRHMYKYVLDEEWVCNEAEATLVDNGNQNNFVDVLPEDPIQAERWQRITDPEKTLTSDELESVRALLASKDLAMKAPRIAPTV
mmetsp:Transcript_39351/g.47694  ORF Transcript_39351/g.47694 Transcript_39351/m.47694 type:complete len:414 (+) Transcript_39351:205-1446(+)|eukprot:CAMPEP_0197861358 /NCGR_PEP_ID=MMETSP1438-20131217/37375_1 /TAXON_ID=1461541 /ORGANISM="Pterosperma sp., Strain CCMP1384" /LENGTH=413 /DNA_ID=CAMNT_0043478511 /DNA_START=193 /DNA_END=1434 /DNA_ORIENTATION=+